MSCQSQTEELRPKAIFEWSALRTRFTSRMGPFNMSIQLTKLLYTAHPGQKTFNWQKCKTPFEPNSYSASAFCGDSKKLNLGIHGHSLRDRYGDDSCSSLQDRHPSRTEHLKTGLILQTQSNRIRRSRHAYTLTMAKYTSLSQYYHSSLLHELLKLLLHL